MPKVDKTSRVERARAAKRRLAALRGQHASDCRSEAGVIVGLIDGMIATARVIAQHLRDAEKVAPEIVEALADIRADEDVAMVARSIVEAHVRAAIANEIESDIPDLTYNDGHFVTATDEARMAVKRRAIAIAQGTGHA
jgi:hypothetical protein